MSKFVSCSSEVDKGVNSTNVSNNPDDPDVKKKLFFNFINVN